MPYSITSAFSEPGDFEAALLKEGCLGLVVTGSGQFRAQLTQVSLHRLRLSAAEEQLARIALIGVPTDMLIAAFPIGDETAPVSGGIPTRSGEIIILPPGEHVHMRTDGPSRWGALWFPVEELQRYGSAVTGASFVVPSAMQVLRPPRAAGRDLRSLHTAGIRMAVTHPQCLVGAEAAHGLEQQLIHAVVDCLAKGSTNEAIRSQRRDRDIMVRFDRLLQTQPDQDMRLSQICTTLGVSERLLRSLCAEHLRMGPAHYQRLRRMSLVRRALLRGHSATTSVSEVARHHGFRSPGRFAVNYRVAFGESPSTTLRRGQDRLIVGL